MIQSKLNHPFFITRKAAVCVAHQKQRVHNNYAKLLDYQAMNAYEAGNIASAKAYLPSQHNPIRIAQQI